MYSSKIKKRDNLRNRKNNFQNGYLANRFSKHHFIPTKGEESLRSNWRKKRNPGSKRLILSPINWDRGIRGSIGGSRYSRGGARAKGSPCPDFSSRDFSLYRYLPPLPGILRCWKKKYIGFVDLFEAPPPFSKPGRLVVSWDRRRFLVTRTAIWDRKEERIAGKYNWTLEKRNRTFSKAAFLVINILIFNIKLSSKLRYDRFINGIINHTHYNLLSLQITQLKIDNNPFAKGFRDTGAGKREKKWVSLSKLHQL